MRLSKAGILSLEFSVFLMDFIERQTDSRSIFFLQKFSKSESASYL